MSNWVPDAGDIVWVDFDPQAGREQAGHRPAVVLSPARYNSRTGLMICVPTTTKLKGWPFEVPLTGEPPSAAIADHVKSLDWRHRRARPKGKVTAAELDEIRAIVASLID